MFKMRCIKLGIHWVNQKKKRCTFPTCSNF